MVWSHADAGTAFDHVRRKAQAANDLLLTAARPVLQYGSRQEVEAFRDAAMIMIELGAFNPRPSSTNGLKPTVTSGGRPGYDMLQLYHSMCLSMQLRNASRFDLAIRTAVQLATGQLDLTAILAEPDSSRGPSSATLSRARYKLDILGMFARRWQWGQSGGWGKHHLTLCYDATQQGKEIFVAEEYSTRVDDAMDDLVTSLALAAADSDVVNLKPLETDVRVLPPVSMGKGYTTLVNKLDALLWTIGLETDLGKRDDSIMQYCQQVICCLSDQGTESKLVESLRIGAASLCQDAAMDLTDMLPLDGGSQSEHQPIANNQIHLQCPGRLGLEDDDPMQQLDVCGPMADDDDALDPKPPDDQERSLALFPNALPVTGIKHITDNIVGAILENLPQWKVLMPSLTSLDTLLSSVTWRERFVALCVRDHPQRDLVEHWAEDQLKGSRWQVISRFCVAVLPLQDLLRSCWNSGLYLTSDANTPRKQPFLVEESSKVTIQHISNLMKSDYLWCCIALIAHVTTESERIGAWAEGCPCPEHQRDEVPSKKAPKTKRRGQSQGKAAECSLKCCRAPELAVGARTGFGQYLAMAPEDKKAELHGSFTKAIGLLWGHINVKLAYWKQLPWLLCGLAYPNDADVQKIAKRCITIFDSAESGNVCAMHAQSRRFLDKQWSGLRGNATDVPLRPLMDRLAAGTTISELVCENTPAVKNFLYWVSAFRLVRVAERSVEGRHSLIHRIRSRAPRCGIPYISLELRFKHLQSLAATQPKSLMQLQHHLESMATSEGFRATVQHLLGFESRAPLNTLTDGDVAKLVYRDNIQIKHASRKRMADEMQALSQIAPPTSLYDRKSSSVKDRLTKQGGPLSKALTAYLLEVSKRDTSLVFSIQKSLLGQHLRNIEKSYPSFDKPQPGPGEHLCQLQDDDANPFDLSTGGDPLVRLNKDFFWFKPVASSMTHHSVLGESLCEFDFLAQGYVVKACQFGEGSTTYPISVTLAEWEHTMSCNISHIPFETLSKSLTVWSDFEITFMVLPSLPSAADKMFRSMATAGAFWDSENVFFVSLDIADDPQSQPPVQVAPAPTPVDDAQDDSDEDDAVRFDDDKYPQDHGNARSSDDIINLHDGHDTDNQPGSEDVEIVIDGDLDGNGDLGHATIPAPPQQSRPARRNAQTSAPPPPPPSASSSSRRPYRARVANVMGNGAASGSASLWNLSTIWVGNVCFIERTDQKARSYYVKCPLHGSHSRSCSKQISRPTTDEMVRRLMYWLLQGFELVKAPTETQEELRQRHVHNVAIPDTAQIPSREELEAALQFQLDLHGL